MTTTPLIVRYCETDRMGIVHHSRYYPWFEVGRTDFIRSLGVSYGKMEEDGVLLPLTETHCKYLRGAKYEDELVIQTRLTALSPARCTFSYTVLRGEEVLARGQTMHGFVDGNFKPLNLKKSRPDWWDMLLSAVEEEA